MTYDGEKTIEERLRSLEIDVEGHGRQLRHVWQSIDELSPRPGVPEPAVPEPAVSGPDPLLEREEPKVYAAGVADVAGAGGYEERLPEAVSFASPISREEPAGPFPAEYAGRRAGGSGRGFEIPFDLSSLRRWEWWLNKVGIGLFLIGVVFLFKLSYDKGWLQVLLTPPVRVGLGMLAGSALTWVGLRVYEERRAFSQVVLGGGIATYYVTGFAAFQMLGVFSYPVAFAFMVAVSLLAFALALRQDEAVLAVIGVSGGLATPFALYDGGGSPIGLVLYAALVLTGAMAIHLFRGWRSLLLVSFAGFWAALLASYAGAVDMPGSVAFSDKIALQFGVIFGWAALGLVPATREALRFREPSRWPLPEAGPFLRLLFAGDERVLRSGAPAHLLAFAAPSAALFFTQGIWHLDRASLGWVALGLAAAHALLSAGFRRVENGGHASYTQALVAGAFATLSIVLLLEGDALLFVLAAEAAILHLVARRLSDEVLSLGAHALFVAVGLWLVAGLVNGIGENLVLLPNPPASLDLGTPVNLAAIALAFASSRLVGPSVVRRVYRACGHAAVVGLMAHELLPLADDGTYILAALALYAAGLHVLSRRSPEWGTVVGAHLLSGGVAVWLSFRLVMGFLAPEDMDVVFTTRSVVDLCAVFLALVVSVLGARREEVVAYRVFACAALSSWLLIELGPLPGGSGYVLLAWTLLAAVLLLLSRRLDAPDLLAAAHAQFAAVGVLLFGRLLSGMVFGTGGTPVIGVDAPIDLAAIVVIGLAFRRVSGRAVLAYRISAHAGLLAWLWRELSALPGSGDAYVTVAWGLCGAGLFVVGLRLDRAYLIKSGLVTLLLVVGKLFLWDLAGVEAVWRVLLFLGFGGLFLALSYYLRNLWNPADEEDDLDDLTPPISRAGISNGSS